MFSTSRLSCRNSGKKESLLFLPVLRTHLPAEADLSLSTWGSGEPFSETSTSLRFGGDARYAGVMPIPIPARASCGLASRGFPLA